MFLITINYCFALQESDRLRDEDLYKFLQDLKRPSNMMKKLKCIAGTLKLDISPCPDEHKYSLTPDLEKLSPYPGKANINVMCSGVLFFFFVCVS